MISENTTTVIPFFYDGQDRITNLRVVAGWMKQTLPDSKTVVLTQDKASKLQAEKLPKGLIDEVIWQKGFLEMMTNQSVSHNLFWRTLLLNNALANWVKTEIAFILDADVIIPKDQIQAALFAFLRDPSLGIVLPYNSPTYDVAYQLRDEFSISWDLTNIIENCVIPRKPHINVGGAIFTKVKEWNRIGGFHPDMISWGSEDEELWDRLGNHSVPRLRIDGKLYHLHHSRGINSGCENPFRWNNMKIRDANRNNTDPLYIQQIRARNKYLLGMIEKYDSSARMVKNECQ